MYAANSRSPYRIVSVIYDRIKIGEAQAVGAMVMPVITPVASAINMKYIMAKVSSSILSASIDTLFSIFSFHIFEHE